VNFKQALNKDIPWFTFIMVTASLTLGLTIAVSCYIFYTESLSTENTSGNENENFLVLNKSVGLFNMFSGENSEFSAEELEELKTLEYVDEVAPFTAAQFRIKAYAPLNQSRSFHTELPLESVPNRFLDIKPGFNWTEGETQLPIVIPHSYFKIYNFAFAPAQGLPQINETSAKTLNIKMEMSSPKGVFTFWGRIHDFTDRVNSILVPEEFIKWANKSIGSDKQTDPSRVVISSSSLLDDRIDKYIEEHGYSTNLELMSEIKKATHFNKILAFESFQGILIFALSIGLILLSSLLIVERNKIIILRLRLLGFSANSITKHYTGYFGICAAIAVVLSLIAAAVLRHIYLPALAERNVAVSHAWWQLSLGVLTIAFSCTAHGIGLFHYKKTG